MPILTWAGLHRIWAVGIGITVVVVLVAAGVWFFEIRSPGTSVDLRQALRLFRENQRSELTGTGDLPTPGVYQYRTSGGEQLSMGGISRGFPAETDMIVTDAGCVTMKWEPLVQHMEGLVACPGDDGALTFTSSLSYEQIAGTSTTSVIRCPRGMYFVPPRPTVGERWRTTCHSPGQNVVFSGSVVGLTSVDVGGQKVPALHTRITLFFSGAQSGTNPNNYWVSLRNGLILRQSETVDVTQKAGPLGSVRYTEQMAITLASTSPVR
jgi:hypothetical protein